MAINDSTSTLARLALATLIVVGLLAAGGLVLETFERFPVLVLGVVALCGVAYYRAARAGGLPSDLIDFDLSGTGLGGGPARTPVLVGVAPAGL
jgi:hypothetical protein